MPGRRLTAALSFRARFSSCLAISKFAVITHLNVLIMPGSQSLALKLRPLFRKISNACAREDRPGVCA